MKTRRKALVIGGLFCLALLLAVALTWAFQVRLRQQKLTVALLNAIDKGDVGAMHRVLARGADPNGCWQDEPPPTFFAFCRQALHGSRPEPGRRLTPLMIAALDGNLETVRILLDAGADVHARDAEGYTPLLWAVCNWWGGSDPILHLLAAHGADIEAKANDGNTAWKLAAANPEAMHALHQISVNRTAPF